MCGIIAYWGEKNPVNLLLQGLKRLEYRGYDSAGIALIKNGKSLIFKAEGGVNNLKVNLPQGFIPNIGIAHNRWATHGEPTKINAHPHTSNDGDLIGVHNGTIENFNSMKTQLEKVGYEFESQTDTEIVINFIDWIRKSHDLNLLDAVRVAQKENIIGTCAMVLYSMSEKCLIAMNKGGELCSGKSESGYFIASDVLAFAGEATNVMDIDNEHILVIRDGEKPRLFDANLESLKIVTKKITTDMSDLSRGEFPHFMLKEIFSQPEVVARALKGRFSFTDTTFRFGGLDGYWDKIKNLKQITIVACGTSYYAGLLGKYWLEQMGKLSVKLEYASEFDTHTLTADDVVIVISQSGSTADTIEALRKSKAKGATVIGIINTVDSTIAKESDAGVYTRAGVEKGVAATKTFTGQAIVLLMIALKLGKEKNIIPVDAMRNIVQHLELLPRAINEVLALNEDIKAIAKKFKGATNCLYLGRGFNFPIAMEGALKLKEISYIHAEGMSSGEMKHGTLALIDENMPVVVIATQGNSYARTLSNLQEVKARKGQIIALISDNDNEIAKMAQEIIRVPLQNEVIAPIVNVVALQLFAYHLAVERGHNPDQPRNLAKSVTVH